MHPADKFREFSRSAGERRTRQGLKKLFAVNVEAKSTRCRRSETVKHWSSSWSEVEVILYSTSGTVIKFFTISYLVSWGQQNSLAEFCRRSQVSSECFGVRPPHCGVSARVRRRRRRQKTLLSKQRAKERPRKRTNGDDSNPISFAKCASTFSFIATARESHSTGWDISSQTWVGLDWICEL